MPLIYVYLALAIGNAATGEELLKKFRDFIKWLMTWMLKTILYDRALREQNDAIASDRRQQVGTGDRSERIRTYNFPQNRVTDHRYNFSSFDLPAIMEGEFERVIDPIMAIDGERRFEELQQ